MTAADKVFKIKKEPSKGVPTKRCFENIQQIYRRTAMPKCEITLQHGCFPETLLHIFRTPFSKNTSGRLVLKIVYQCINSISIIFKTYQYRLPSLISIL